MRYLTKSRFSLALQCPTKLEYCDDPSFANADADNEFLAALADGGHQVGALAKCLFPEGMEIDVSGHDAQAAQTAHLLQQENATLFEAAIRFGRLFIRADLLHKHGDVIDLYEVKAKGFDSTDPDSQVLGKRGGFLSGMKPYLYDVAFQRYVLRKAFPEATIRAHLVMPDKSATCHEAELAQRLRIRKDGRRVRIDVDPSLQDGALARQVLCIVPVDSYLDRLEQEPLQMGAWITSFAEGIEDLARRLDEEPYSPRPGGHCKSCQFRATAHDIADGKQDGRLRCWTASLPVTLAGLATGSVFDIYASRATDTLLEAGKVLQVDLEPEDLKLAEKPDEISSSHRQWLQCEEARGALTHPFIRTTGLQNSVATLAYPLHFIDFETSRSALPFHADRRPYEQLLFQFSHHQLEQNGALRHATEYLADSTDTLPSFSTVRALRLALGKDQGSVLHWWDHERTVLGEIREQLEVCNSSDLPDRDELLEFIDQLVGTRTKSGRLVDLGRLIHRTVFFPGTRGSSSLKKVLPALLNSSVYLKNRYANPLYGRADGIPSLNFSNQAWVQAGPDGRVADPYSLLGERVEDPDLKGLEKLEDDNEAIADGGAAMVAYGLLQNGLLAESERKNLRSQLLRYCELDTLAMVMAWEGLQELLGNVVSPNDAA